MAACSAWTYKNVTVSVFKALQSLGRQRGFTIPNTPSGKFTISISAFNVAFAYAWDAQKGILLLSCESKPILLGCGTIKSYADKIVAESGGKVSS